MEMKTKGAVKAGLTKLTLKSGKIINGTKMKNSSVGSVMSAKR